MEDLQSTSSKTESSTIAHDTIDVTSSQADTSKQNSPSETQTTDLSTDTSGNKIFKSDIN